MLPLGKTAKRRNGSFRFRAVGGKDALRAGTTDALNLRGVCQSGFLMMVVLWSQNG
jgi:hypothetical protein